MDFPASLQDTIFILRSTRHNVSGYQGSNLTHWTFDETDQSSKIKANYLCANSFLIADGDAVQLPPEDLRELASAASKIPVQGARYPEHLQKLVGR